MAGGSKKGRMVSSGAAVLVTAFLDALTLERGISVHTRTAYARDLELLTHSLAARGLGLLQAGPDDLVSFLEECSRSGAAPRTRARRAAAIRSFYRHVSAEGACPVDPGRLLSSPRLPKLLPKALTYSETERMLHVDAQGDVTLAGRDSLVLELLYGCGLRASELAGLRCTDFDLDGGFVRVSGKGGKTRVVPISTTVREALSRWMKQGRHRVLLPASGDALLLTSGGQPFSRAHVHAVVTACARRAGITRRVTPHTLRHTFATHLVKGGADLRAVQEMMGHASIDTTQVYTTLAEEHLHAAHKRFHPRS